MTLTLEKNNPPDLLGLLARQGQTLFLGKSNKSDVDTPATFREVTCWFWS